MRKREMRGDGGNYHDNLELKRILCMRQFNIPNRAGTSPNPACINTDMRSSQPSQACRNPNLSCLVVSCISLSSSTSISRFLVHTSAIIAEYNETACLYIPPCHDEELTPTIAYIKYCIHRVQHTPSTAYTEYSIHRVQHTPSTAYTEYSIHRVHHTPSTAYSKYSTDPTLFVLPSF